MSPAPWQPYLTGRTSGSSEATGDGGMCVLDGLGGARWAQVLAAGRGCQIQIQDSWWYLPHRTAPWSLWSFSSATVMEEGLLPRDWEGVVLLTRPLTRTRPMHSSSNLSAPSPALFWLCTQVLLPPTPALSSPEPWCQRRHPAALGLRCYGAMCLLKGPLPSQCLKLEPSDQFPFSPTCPRT